MSKFLISTVESWRVDTEEEAKILIEEAKNESLGEVAKYSCVHKENKKAEEEWYQVSITKEFTDMKIPEIQVEVSYNV